MVMWTVVVDVDRLSAQTFYGVRLPEASLPKQTPYYGHAITQG